MSERKPATPKTDDLSESHLKWLVQSRSRNQQVTLDLYLTIISNAASIDGDLRYKQLAQELAAIAFSLWRAVFLSDLTNEVEDQMIDVERFLGTLISHNTIAYQQDRVSREWTFQYYLINARQRLLTIARESVNIISVVDVEIEAHSAKEDWSIAQDALAKAVKQFNEVTGPTH